MLETVSIITMALLAIAVVKIFLSFFIKKPLKILHHDQFRSEINKLKHYNNQVLCVYDNGYWEIKEASVSKEWSSQAGTQTIVDLDSDINSRRYKKMTGESIQRDKYGEYGIRILKEVDLSKDHDPDHLLAMKI